MFGLRLYLGKNSVAQIALGRTVEDEYKENLHRLSKVSVLYWYLSNHVDLMTALRTWKEMLAFCLLTEIATKL